MSLSFGRNKIAIVKIEGVIADGDGFSANCSRIVALIKEAERRGAKALVLRINSPGGSVAACQEVHSAIKRIKEKGRPIVASMGDIAASGGIYIAMAADEIVANAGTVTGSIGVIIRSSNLSNLYQKVGVAPKVIKSGPHKDMLATYRSLSDEEQALLQDVINDSHDQFVEVVATARKKSREDIGQIADGRILTGRQALSVGLVDSIGDLDAAVERAAVLAGLERKPRTIVLQAKKRSWRRLLGPFSAYGLRIAEMNNLSGVPLWILPTS